MSVLSILLAAPPLIHAQGQAAQARGGGGGGGLVAIDFANASLGAPPAEIRVLRGTFEVVNKDGTRMLRCSEEGAFLLMLPEKIPNKFALEFDLVPKFSGATNTTELSFEGTREVSHSEESAHVHWNHHKVSVIGGGQTYAGGQIDLPEDLREEVIGFLTKIRAEFEGSNLTVKTNGRTVFESKIAKFNRGRVVRVSLGGTDDGDNAVYLASMRLIALDGGSGGSARASQNGTAAPSGGNAPGKGSTQQQGASGDTRETAESRPVDQPDDPDTPLVDESGQPGQTSTNTSDTTTQEGTGDAATTAVTGIDVRIAENGNVWVGWDPIEEAFTYFAICWDREVARNFQVMSQPDFGGTGWDVGVLPAAGNYAIRVFAKVGSVYVTGETMFTYGGASNQQAGTSTGGTQPVSTDPSGQDGTGTTGAAAPATGTGVVLRVNSDGGAIGQWDPVPDAISYFAVLWNATDQNAVPWVTSSQDFNNARMLPGLNSTGWQIGILPSHGTYVLRVYATTASGGVATGEAQVNFSGVSNEHAGTIGPATPATDTGVAFNVNSDGGAWATWDPVPGAISYTAILWNATNQNATPWITSSQDFNNARMQPDFGGTGWQIGILPSAGTYVFRVYAKTTDGYAVGEAQAQFSGAATQQTGAIGTGATGVSVQDPGTQTGTTGTTGQPGTTTGGSTAPASITGLVAQANEFGGAWANWDYVPGALSYFWVCWNTADPYGLKFTSSPEHSGNGTQIGVLTTAGTYGFRVYAKTASGYVVGETQFSFGGVAGQQSGTLQATTGTTTQQATGTAVVAAPAAVTGIMIGNIDSTTVSITWDPVPGATSYVVSRWNVFDPDCCNWTSVPVPTPATMAVSMPPVAGAYGFRVVATTANGDVVGETRIQWGGAASQQTGTTGTGATGGSIQDPATQTGQIVQSGNYKVSVTGLAVYNPTNEDPSIADGTGDEVFVCAVVSFLDRTTSGEMSFGQIQSVDYGDVADGRYTGRVRAGRASQTGGLRGQDVVPDGFDPSVSSSGAPQPEHLPLVMWEGSLTAGREIVILSPSVWEHDGARDAVNSYFTNWQSYSRSELLSSLPVQASLSDGKVGATEAVFFPDILSNPAATSFSTPPWTGYKLAGSAFKAGVDRPIGFESTPGDPDTLKFGERFLVITQEKVASLQVGQAITVPVNFTESTEPNVGGGNYRLFVRIDRTE